MAVRRRSVAFCKKDRSSSYCWGTVEMRVCRQPDRYTFRAHCAIAMLTTPPWTVVCLCQIPILGHLDDDAGIVIRPITSMARPSSAGVVEVGIGWHLDRHAGLGELLITTFAFPSAPIRTACRISVIKHFDSVAGTLVAPVAWFAFTAFSIARSRVHYPEYQRRDFERTDGQRPRPESKRVTEAERV